MLSARDNPDHLVVLMLEKPPFDGMLGWHYDPANTSPFDRVPCAKPYDGGTLGAI